MGSVPTATDELTALLEKHRATLQTISKEIHSHPELAYEEVYAHDTLCGVLSELGYKVTRHAYGLNTSFEAEAGTGGAVLTYNAEYDALPDIGHACGHNLIATSSLGAFLVTAEALAKSGQPGRVRLLGTPAEEGGGGKVDLIRAGAYKDVDACLMGHPMGDGGVGAGGPDGVVLMRMMGRAAAKVTFRGVNAHAGDAPWLGRNALDAVVAAYTNLSMLRQQTPPNQRMHAVITNGGDRPNIIPHVTTMLVYIRAEAQDALEERSRRVVDCCEGAAKAAGCTVEFAWENSYKDLRCSNAIATRFSKLASEQNQTYAFVSKTVSGGSTDQGNVGYEIPSLHPSFHLSVDNPAVNPHSPAFREAAGSADGFEAALRFAKVLAATGLDILQDKALRDEMWAEHKGTKTDGFEATSPDARRREARTVMDTIQ